MSSGSVSSSIAGHQPTSKETVSFGVAVVDADVGHAEEARRLRRGGRGAGRRGRLPARAGSALTVCGASSQLRERRGKPRSVPAHTITCQLPPAGASSVGRARTRRGRVAEPADAALGDHLVARGPSARRARRRTRPSPGAGCAFPSGARSRRAPAGRRRARGSSRSPGCRSCTAGSVRAAAVAGSAAAIAAVSTREARVMPPCSRAGGNRIPARCRRGRWWAGHAQNTSWSSARRAGTRTPTRSSSAATRRSHSAPPS